MGEESVEPPPPAPPSPLRILLVSGGANHDYAMRSEILVQGISERMTRAVQWTRILDAVGESGGRIPLFESAEWAQSCDVVVHDLCLPGVRDAAYINRIVEPHRQGTPMVLLHAATLSFPTGDGAWSQLVGAKVHGGQGLAPITMKNREKGAGADFGLKSQIFSNEELYRVEALSGTEVLIDGVDPAKKTQALVWRHQPDGKGRVFATSLGNALHTLSDPSYLNLVTKGILWSVGDEDAASFRSVSPEKSLANLGFELPQEPLVRLGANALLGAEATSFTWKDSAIPRADVANDPAWATDGDPATAWTPDWHGPGVWQAKLPQEREIASAAILWRGKAPDGALLEGAQNEENWVLLSDRIRSTPDAEGLSVVHFPPQRMRHLRISVPKGDDWGLREIALYESKSEMPTALRKEETEDVPLRTMAGEGIGRQFRLRAGWQWMGAMNCSERGVSVASLVPTASGDAFVVFHPHAKPGEEPGLAAVYRLRLSKTGSWEELLYMDSLALDTQIAWDGEWCYTLSGSRLDRVRNARARGPANERMAAREVYSFSEQTAPLKLAITGFRMGDDGWLYGRAAIASSVEVQNREGDIVRIPPSSDLRFRPDGSGLSVVPRSDFDSSSEQVAQELGEVRGLVSAVRDGDVVWVQVRHADQLYLCLLQKKGEDSLLVPDWNRVSTEDLLSWIVKAGRPSIRREAAAEVLRRKKSPEPILESLLEKSYPEEVFIAALSIAEGLGAEKSRHWITRFAASSHPESQFVGLRSVDKLTNDLSKNIVQQFDHKDIDSINVERIAELLDILRERDFEVPEAAAFALRNLSHPDSVLANASRRYLVARRASSVVLSAFDESSDSTEQGALLSLLLEMPSREVLDGLVERVQKSSSPPYRWQILDALCGLWSAMEKSGEHKEEATRVSRILQVALGDPRENRAALLATMMQKGIPLPQPDLLVSLAKDDMQVEPLVLRYVESQKEKTSIRLRNWLQEVASDPSREKSVRDLAAQILVGRARPQLGEEPLRGLVNGKRLFLRQACATCHDLSGERATLGPDLSLVLAGKSRKQVEEIVKGSIAHPSREDGSSWLLEDKEGRRRVVWIHERDEKQIVAEDRAGNVMQLPTESIAFSWKNEFPLPDCVAAKHFDESDFSDLIDYLLSWIF